MDLTELSKILELHRKWLSGEEEGRRADLSSANLSGANLSSANLSRANLSRAYLGSAYLGRADLSGTILDDVDWLAWIGIVPDRYGKARAYKYTDGKGKSIHYPCDITYASGQVVSASLNPDVNLDCAQGVNLATLAWCLSNESGADRKLWLCEFNVTPENVCVPIGSSGKFRVGKCKVITECDMKGRPIKEVSHE